MHLVHRAHPLTQGYGCAIAASLETNTLGAPGWVPQSVGTPTHLRPDRERVPSLRQVRAVHRVWLPSRPLQHHKVRDAVRDDGLLQDAEHAPGEDAEGVGAGPGRCARAQVLHSVPPVREHDAADVERAEEALVGRVRRVAVGHAGPVLRPNVGVEPVLVPRGPVGLGEGGAALAAAGDGAGPDVDLVPVRLPRVQRRVEVRVLPRDGGGTCGSVEVGRWGGASGGTCNPLPSPTSEACVGVRS